MKSKNLCLTGILIACVTSMTIPVYAVTGGISFEAVQKSMDSAKAKGYMTSDEMKSSYTSGQYKVGIDIPDGEYMLFASGEMGYFCVSSDSNGADIIKNDNFDYNSIITVSDSQYLELVRCYAKPIDNVNVDEISLDGEGMFKVGEHIPAGEYKLYSSAAGYYCVYADSTQQDIISNNNFEGNQYVTVEDGQYLQLVRCQFETPPQKVDKIFTDSGTIKKVQEMLNEAGYNCGVPDGQAGPKTQQAIMKFKVEKGLGSDNSITQSFLDFLEKL